MRLLLIGATGQIGYALTAALARTAHRVRVLVRDPRGLPFPAGVEVERQPAFTGEAFRRALTDVDHVIYGVGLPEQFLADRAEHDRVNRGLLASFLEELARSPVRRLTYVSTYEVFEPVGGVIRESHPVVADGPHLTPYFRAMGEAFRMVRRFADAHGTRLTTIHPAAVYGGLNTGRGFTDYVENLLHRRYGRVPFIFPGRFPVVHADSLAAAVVGALDASGAYLVSDQMTDLQEIARVLRRHARSYVPPSVPAWVARLGTGVLDPVARLTGTAPIMARVQVAFITSGAEPKAERAAAELGWTPMPLEDGLRRYLAQRGTP